MTTAEIDQIVEKMLADDRISRGERHALKLILQEGQVDDGGLAVIRHRAFEVARQQLTAPESSATLGWLEELLKVLQPEPARAQMHSEAYFRPGDDCVGKIVRLLRHAASTIDICVFTITDDRISNAIIAAHQRHVAIRIIADDTRTEDCGSDIGRFERLGLPVRVDRSEFCMHHKFAIFDEASLLTGSYNWTRGAAENNMENFIVTHDARLVGSFSAKFEQLWQQLDGLDTIAKAAKGD